MIRGNKINIGSMEGGDTAIRISGNVSDNEINIEKMGNYKQGVVIVGGITIQEQLGLPADVDIEHIKEALKTLKDKEGATLEEKAEAIKPLAIWKYLERAGSVTDLVRKLVDLVSTVTNPS